MGSPAVASISRTTATGMFSVAPLSDNSRLSATPTMPLCQCLQASDFLPSSTFLSGPLPAASQSRWRGVPNVRAQERGRNTAVSEKPAKLKSGQGGNMVESQHGAYVVYPPTIPVKRRVGRSLLPPKEEKDARFLERAESTRPKVETKRAKKEAGVSTEDEEEPHFRGQSDVRLDYDIRPVVKRIQEEGLEVMALFVDKLGVRDMDRILLKFGGKGQWQLALRVFEWMLKDRFLQPDQKTYTIMLDILGTNKQPQLAEEMFQSMQEEGLVDTRACNALLNAYAQVGQAKQATALFSYMKQQGMRLDAYTYSSVIKALSQDRSRSEDVLDLFNEMQAARITPTSTIYSQLISTLGSAGYVDQAETTFRQMQRSGVAPELFAYNALLAAYTKNQLLTKVETLFEELKEANFKPSKHTYSTVMNAYGSAGDLESAERIFQEYLDSDQVQDPGPHNTLMGIYARRGYLTKALQIFVGMSELGASPNDVSAVIILSSLVRAKKLDEAQQLHETIKELEIPHSTQLWNAVIHMYGKAGKVDKAREAYATMVQEGFRPNEVTNRELAALEKLESCAQTRPVNGTPTSKMEQPSLLDVIEKAGAEGRLRDAFEVLRKVVASPHAASQVHAFTAFFRACDKAGEWEPVHEMFTEMMRQGIQPTVATYHAVLQVYCKQNQLPRAEAVFNEMKAKGISPLLSAYNMRINGYGRVRDFEAMEDVFAELQASPERPDEVSFNTMINHYLRTHHFDSALSTLQRMLDARLRPNDVTYGIIKHHCDVSPEQVRTALQQGTFEGVLSPELLARQQRMRRRHVGDDALGQSDLEEATSRNGTEALVEDPPSSSSAADEDPWVRTLLEGLDVPKEVQDAVRWSGPDPPLSSSNLRDRVQQLLTKEGSATSWKVKSLNSLLYDAADNLYVHGALHVFDRMVERNIPIRKKGAMKLLENLARTRNTEDMLWVRTLCEKQKISSFIYVSEAVERELERAGQVSVHVR